MIVKQYYKTREDNVKLYKSVSDRGFKIRKISTGEIYDDAVDVEGALYTYEETDIPVNIDIEN